MRLPSVAPISGSAMSNVNRWLAQANSTFSSGFSGQAPEVLQGYQRESVQLADSLSYMFSASDVETMILTRRHWLLMSISLIPENWPVIQDLVRLECRDRANYFEALIKELRAIELQWESSKVAALIAPDTNVYLHQDSFFEEIDWKALAGGREVRLIVPMQVVRELDIHKNGARNAVVSDTCNETVRLRARRTVKRLRELFVDPRAAVTLNSGVPIALITDSAGHRPGADGDAEIIDRLVTLSSVIQQPVYVATADGGMDFAAKMEDLRVIGL